MKEDGQENNDSPELGEIRALLDLIAEERLAEAVAGAGDITRRFPSYAFGWTMLGAICEQTGDMAAALGHMRRAVMLSPDNPDVHVNLGNLLRHMGRGGEAEASLSCALRLKGDHAEANHSLGILLKSVGRLGEAEACFRQVLRARPDSHETYSNLGNTLVALGRWGEAEACYRKALELRADFFEAHGGLAIVLMQQGRWYEAAGSCRQALRLRPDDAGVHVNLGNVLRELGQLDEAAASYCAALQLKPDFAEAYYNLGDVLRELGQADNAVASYRQALELRPAYAEAHNNLGVVLQKLGQLDEAEECLRQAVHFRPGFAEGYSNLAGVLKDQGRLDEALACDRRAVELDPDSVKLHSNLLYTLCFHPELDEQAILAEARKFASSHPVPQSPPARPRSEGTAGRLRIGYVSPNFRNHCQSLFTLPLLSNHDHGQFEIYCYADLLRPDEVSEQLAACADVWRPAHLMSDGQLAQMIAGDGIDVLVDLTMHMARGRPMLFARRPAPVQLTWLAYPGTTGIPGMDYRLSDPWLDPPELGDERYTEKSIRLPDTFWCYDPLISGLWPNELPALENGYVTFGCLNNFCKVSDDTLRRWGEIMARLPESRLLLLADMGKHRQRVLDLLGRHGISGERVEFVELRPRAQYLQTYHRIDICLDTLPYNGHTTSLDALWMGVPVLTQVGNTVAGRAGWSQLNNLGLSELAAFDEGNFIGNAVGLASDPPRLSRLRATLRDRMEQSPLMDGRRFCSAVENVYRRIMSSP